MLENKVWPAMRATTPANVTAHRIETGKTAPGIADVLFFIKSPLALQHRVGWVENKTALKADGRLMLREGVGAAQADFLSTACGAGCRGSVVIWWDEGDWIYWLLVEGQHAPRLVGLRYLPLDVLRQWSGAAGKAGSAREAARSVWAALTGTW